MVESTTKVPVKTETKAIAPVLAPQTWHPLESLRREVDRLFNDFGRDFWPSRQSIFGMEPFGRYMTGWSATPAVDIVEKKDAYEITAEMPGMDEKNVEVKLVNGSLMIKGERHDEKEEKKKDYYLQERQFGTFERRFTLPDGVDTGKVEASFKKGVLTVILPKKAEAQSPEKKIEIKAA